MLRWSSLVLLGGCVLEPDEDWPVLHLVVETEGAQLDRVQIVCGARGYFQWNVAPPLTPELLAEGATEPPDGDVYFDDLVTCGYEVENPGDRAEWTLGAPFETFGDEVWLAITTRPRRRSWSTRRTRIATWRIQSATGSGIAILRRPVGRSRASVREPPSRLTRSR